MWTDRMEHSFELVIEHVGPLAATRLLAHGPYWYWVIELCDGVETFAHSGTFEECRDLDIRYKEVRDTARLCEMFNALWPSVAAISN